MSDIINVTGFDSGDAEERLPLRVEIRCVTPPDEEQLEKIRDFMSRRYNDDNVEFSVIKDPSVIGGFKIFVGDDNYDWSALGRIRQLRKSFQALRREDDHDKIISLLREDISSFKLDAGYQHSGHLLQQCRWNIP